MGTPWRINPICNFVSRGVFIGSLGPLFQRLPTTGGLKQRALHSKGFLTILPRMIVRRIFSKTWPFSRLVDKWYSVNKRYTTAMEIAGLIQSPKTRKEASLKIIQPREFTTLPEINIAFSREKKDGWKTILSFWDGPFSGPMSRLC